MSGSQRNAGDRCPACHGPMHFAGVSNRKGWTRWTECEACGTWVVADGSGSVIEVSKTPAAKGQFRTGRETYSSGDA